MEKYNNTDILHLAIDLITALTGQPPAPSSGLATESTLQTADLHIQQAVAELGDISTFTQTIRNYLTDGGISIAQISSDSGNKLNSILNELELLEATDKVQHVVPTFFNAASISDLNTAIYAYFQDPGNLNKRMRSCMMLPDAVATGYSAIVMISGV